MFSDLFTDFDYSFSTSNFLLRGIFIINLSSIYIKDHHATNQNINSYILSYYFFLHILNLGFEYFFVKF